ncbi:hypothetical protein CPB83DRAFT_889265 [Crepidotus variabilis]|uniref:F-box domain-containing protein n=1 Tax=Crepidotus variabilis TaxID=179855 RepID=A0A9P6ESR6_9AGAR|nr:hypothetical protein CPB83DRAFT_889265 [Crepidotus variabilis]
MSKCGLPVEVVDHCLEHLPPESLAICLMVSQIFWKRSRPLIFREVHVSLRLHGGKVTRETTQDVRRFCLLMDLIHPDDVQYSIRPLVWSMVLNIALGILGFPPAEILLVTFIELLLFANTNLSSLSLTLDGFSTAGLLHLPLKNGLIRLIQQPTLRHLSIYLMPHLPIDIFNNLNLESLDLNGCSIAPTSERFAALPLKRYRTDHMFPVCQIYSKPPAQIPYQKPPPGPYSSLERYEAESFPSELPADFAIVQRSFQTLQELIFVIEGINS